MENPPAALAQPAGSISIVSCGAVADNTPTNGAADPASVDSRAAIQNCVNQAQSQGRTLWIPAGTFYVKGTQGLQAQGITIAGAGMWHSTIYRDVPLPNSTPLPALFNVTSSRVQNFHVDSNATSRASVDGAGGSMDTTGSNWAADGIWTQHTPSGFWASGTGGAVRNSRLTTIWADGINLNNVSMGASTGNNLSATNNFVRGTGDDGMAINSVNYDTDSNGNRTYYTPMSTITFTNNTVASPGRNGIAVAPPFYPAPSGSASITGTTVSGLRAGMSAYINNSGGFTATLSGNSWQGPNPEGPFPSTEPRTASGELQHFNGTPIAVPGIVQRCGPGVHIGCRRRFQRRLDQRRAVVPLHRERRIGRHVRSGRARRRTE